ncbi:MAG: cytochrome ubiquinol oxidase subunit I [Thermoanaerobaculia bacterium]
MYPVWEVPVLTSGIILGLIAAFHILPSHLSTSLMWFNVIFERKAYKENKPEYLEFIKKNTLLLLIFAYIFGSLTGVGIWFSATLANPKGLSALIHNYVWGWATEWCFFIMEVLAIYIYYYSFGRVSPKTHLKIGYIFAFASWISMVIIVGILAFQLTPGKWLETGNFFDGFFNPTYFPQLLVRTFYMFAIGGLFALAVASRIKNIEARAKISKFSAGLGILGLILGSIFINWYIKMLPENSLKIFSDLKFTGLYKLGQYSVLLILLYFIFVYLKPRWVHIIPSILFIIIAFGGIWSGERLREIARKPYVIRSVMYSNQIISGDIPSKNVKSEIQKFNESGLLSNFILKDSIFKEGAIEDKMLKGRILAQIQCVSCHCLQRKGLRPLPVLLERVGAKSEDEISGILDMLQGYSFMPPFVGTEEEKQALSLYLSSLTKGGK